MQRENTKEKSDLRRTCALICMKGEASVAAFVLQAGTECTLIQIPPGSQTMFTEQH